MDSTLKKTGLIFPSDTLSELIIMAQGFIFVHYSFSWRGATAGELINPGLHGLGMFLLLIPSGVNVIENAWRKTPDGDNCAGGFFLLSFCIAFCYSRSQCFLHPWVVIALFLVVISITSIIRGFRYKPTPQF